MSNLSGLKHGDSRNRKINVAGTGVIRREKYCIVHGWLDVFICPNFDERHGRCGKTPARGAEFEEKAMRKAA